MPYVVNDKCIMCKHTDCVEVCPVDAIQGEGDEGAFEWIEFNQKYSEQWPNITVKKDALPDAERYATEEGKMKYFKEGEIND